MKGKLLFVVGLGVGYVLGTRAGRRRYEQIKAAASKLWESPVVQKPMQSAQDYAADRIGDLGNAVTESIKRAVSNSGGSSRTGKAGAGSPGNGGPDATGEAGAGTGGQAS